MSRRLTAVTSQIRLPKVATTNTVRNMASSTRNGSSMPSDWHQGPDDSFHGRITSDGPFQPEAGRYHLYVGLFCPFAHRANLIRKLKQLEHYAGIDISIAKPYPKGDSNGWPGWRFNCLLYTSDAADE